MSSVSSLNSLLSSASISSTSSVDLSSLLAAATGASSTGIDVTSAVDAAVYAAQAPERQWQTQQSTISSQITALTSIQTAVGTLSSDLDALNTTTGALNARTVTSSNSSAVTATASTGTTGTHTVSVNNLATAASWYSPVLASSGTSLGSSTLTITGASGSQSSFSLQASGDNTLSSLAASINAAGLGINASVVQEASGSRLALVGSSTGANANFTVTDTGSSAGSWTSACLVSASSALPASSFQIGDGISTSTINVSAGSTLANVADQINAQGLAVTATVVSDASGSRLQVSSTTGGVVTMSSDPAMALTQASQATDASLTVDGVPVTSATNTVSNALSGITLHLTGITSGSPATLDVTADTSTIDSAVTKLVTDYNAAVSLLSAQFTYSASTGSEGVLGSDTSVRSLQSTLLGMGSYSAGSSGTSSSVSTLADLGITMNDDGTLSLDTSTLDQVLGQDPQAVQNFFQGTALNGFAGTMQTQLKSFADPSVGTLAVDLNSLNQQYSDLQSDVNNYESGYIASQRTLLTNMYSKAEIALQSLPSTLKQLDAQLNGNSSN